MEISEDINRAGVSGDITYCMYLNRELVKEHLNWDATLKWRGYYKRMFPTKELLIEVEVEYE